VELLNFGPAVQRLALLLAARGERITTAESCTGGLVAAACTARAGSSDWFERGFVTYSNEAKTDLLGVDAALIAACGAVSEEVARAMAAGALARSRATLAAAVTGIAGPGGSGHKPEGRVCFGLATRTAPTWSETVDFGPLGRAGVREASVGHALAMLQRALRGADRA
jgi:nicotinamide-nucleotide amidase